MPEKRSGRPRQKAAKANAPKAPLPRAASAGVNKYIAGQLKAMYDEVIAQPIPERLLRLLDCLEGDAEKERR